MSTYTPKRKTSTGVEEVTFPISSVDGLQENLDTIDKKTLNMPKIRLGAVSDVNGTMIPSSTNPLIFAVQITDGKLQVGDSVQICTRQLFTYDNGAKRKYKLRSQWHTTITEENVNNSIIFVSIYDTPTGESQRLFKTGSIATFGTFSPLYIRVRRPVYNNGADVDGRFSNIITVFKKYERGQGKVFIK